MRSSELIINEIDELKEIIKEADILQQDCFENVLLQIAFKQDKDRYKYLLKELEQALQHENKHSLKFIIKNAKEGHPILCERFMTSVMAFQRLIQEIGKELFNINKNDLNLSFNYTFKGSFGVLLTTEKKDMELMSKSYLTLCNIFETLQSLNNDKILNQFIKTKLQNTNMLKKYKIFYQTQSKYNNDISIAWGDTQSKNSSVYITKERLFFITNALTDYEYMPDEVIQEQFTIKGISLIKKRIELESKENEILNAVCENEQILIKAGQNINKKISFVVKVSKKENHFTETVEKSYEVVNIV